MSLLGLESPVALCIKADLAYVYKIVFNLVGTDSEKFFGVTGNNRGTRGHAYKLYINYSYVNTKKHFFCNNVANVLNALEASPADFRMLQTFKQFLKTAGIVRHI